MRKPADKLRPDQTRQAIWDWIRGFNKTCSQMIGEPQQFRAKDVAAGISASSVNEYLTGLANAGYLSAERSEKLMGPTFYTLIKDNGQEAPRVRTDGTLVTQGMAREKMWIAMGICAQKGKQFTIKDLTIGSTALIPVAESDAKHYCHHLHHAGYLVAVKPGSPGRPTVYRMPLNKWSGPKPVQIQRTRRCFDPNTGVAAHINVISIEGGE